MTPTEKQLHIYENQQRHLARQLASIGFIWPGTLTWNYVKCGKSACLCRTDPTKRHGPYAYWTTKQEQKTVGKSIPPDQAPLLEEWIENRRTIDAVLKEMKVLSQKAFDTIRKLKQEELPKPSR